MDGEQFCISWSQRGGTGSGWLWDSWLCEGCVCIYGCQYRHHSSWGSVWPQSCQTCVHRLGVTCVWGQGATVASQAWLGIPTEEFGKLETTMLLLLFFREIVQTVTKSPCGLSKLRVVNSNFLHPWRYWKPIQTCSWATCCSWHFFKQHFGPGGL